MPVKFENGGFQKAEDAIYPKASCCVMQMFIPQHIMAPYCAYSEDFDSANGKCIFLLLQYKAEHIYYLCKLAFAHRTV